MSLEIPIHIYAYICGIRFLFTAHAFSIDLPSSLSLSWHSCSTSWNTYDQGPLHTYTHSSLGRLALLLSSSRLDTWSRGMSQCNPEQWIQVWEQDRDKHNNVIWFTYIHLLVNGNTTLPQFIRGVTVSHIMSAHIVGLLLPVYRVLPQLAAGAWAKQLYAPVFYTDPLFCQH